MILKRVFIYTLFLLGVALHSQGKVTLEEVAASPERASGLFRLYPDKGIPALTAAPKGYKPFYISHYGRHGSRWLGSVAEYERVLNPLRDAAAAGTITPKGKEVLAKAEAAFTQATGLVGSLSPLGTRQHKGIASRMAANYPEVFAGKPQIDARATIIVRCIMSMNAFCERLKESYPKADITYEASVRSTGPLEYLYETANEIDPEYTRTLKHGEHNKLVFTLVDEKLNGPEFVKSLLGTDSFKNGEKRAVFMLHLYYLAANLQSVMPEVALWDTFTPQQLLDISTIENFRSYAKRGPHPECRKWSMEYAKRLLRDIDSRAIAAVDGKNGRAADLRFGHDINLMGLLSLMRVNGADVVETDPYRLTDTWETYQLTPMAANLQMVFFRNNKNDVLVKFLVNEREARLPITAVKGAYYKWSDVKNHFTDCLATNYSIDKDKR